VLLGEKPLKSGMEDLRRKFIMRAALVSIPLVILAAANPRMGHSIGTCSTLLTPGKAIKKSLSYYW